MKKVVALLCALLLAASALAGCVTVTPINSGPAPTEDAAAAPSPAPPAHTLDAVTSLPATNSPAYAAPSPHPEEPAWEEGDDGNYMDTDQAEFCGYWHASPFVGSGYSARYLLDVDGSFVYGCDEMDGLERMRYSSGNWYIDGNRLCLEVWERIVWEGGEEVKASGSTVTEKEIINAKVARVDYDEAELETHYIAAAEPNEDTGKRAVMIDGVLFYSFEEPTDLFSVFLEMKELAE